MWIAYGEDVAGDVQHFSRECMVSGGRRHRLPWRLWCDAFKEGRDRHAESEGEPIKTARGDPVGAALVFLELLVSHPNEGGQLLLGHMSSQALLSNARANVYVDRVRLGVALRSTIAGPHGELLAERVPSCQT